MVSIARKRYKKGKKKKNQNALLLVLILIIAISAIALFKSGVFSIVGSYDNYPTEFDPYSKTDICQGLDKEYKVVTRSFPRSSTIELPDNAKVRMFCGIGPDIGYDPVSDKINIGKLDSVTNYFEIDLYNSNSAYDENVVGIGVTRNSEPGDDRYYFDGKTFSNDTHFTKFFTEPVEILAGQGIYALYSKADLGGRLSDTFAIPLTHQSVEITGVEYDRIKTDRSARIYFTSNDWPDDRITLTYAIPDENISPDIHYRDESCPLPEGFVLATETFKSGSTFSTDVLRYPPSYFCKRHPILVTKKSDSSTKNCPGQSCRLGFDPYKRLVSGGSIQVGNDETMTVFYVISANENLPIVCDITDAAYDVETEDALRK